MGEVTPLPLEARAIIEAAQARPKKRLTRMDAGQAATHRKIAQRMWMVRAG